MSVSTIKIETDLITLMKVLDKTGNPTVAFQILNGTYQEPEFCKEDTASPPNKNGTREQYIFESYDIWTDEVRYKVSGSFYTRNMPREHWHKLDIWWHVLDSQIHEMDDVTDTEHGF
jgi:hypothetical protein